MTSTPMTDAEEYTEHFVTSDGRAETEKVVKSEFARSLERRISALETALKPFASLDISSADVLRYKDDRPVFGLNRTHFTVGDVRTARALLNLTPPTQ